MIDAQLHDWPLYAYGNPKQSRPGGQWEAWISAGGQNDAIVCHGASRQLAQELRAHILQYVPQERQHR